MKPGILFAVALFAAAGIARPAMAEAPQTSVVEPAAPPVFASALSIGDDVLAAITGEANVSMEVRAQNTSNVSNNSVNGNSVTGAIGFDSQAFQNLSGLAVVSANSGNNVSINSSLNVNVALNP